MIIDDGGVGGMGGACHQGGVGPWALCLFWEAGFRVVSDLVARRDRWLGLLII